jgi:hypothetical protein
MEETHRRDEGVDREHRAQTQAHRELTARVGTPLVRQKKGRRRLFGGRRATVA